MAIGVASLFVSFAQINWLQGAINALEERAGLTLLPCCPCLVVFISFTLSLFICDVTDHDDATK